MTTNVCATSDALVGVQAEENNSNREMQGCTFKVLYPSIQHENSQEHCSGLEDELFARGGMNTTYLRV